MEQIGIITGRLNDPAFREAWDLLMKSVNDIRAGLGLSTETLRDAASTTTEAAQDACSGECEVKRQFANGALRGAAVLSLRRTLRNRLLLRLYGFLQGSARSPGAQPAAPDEVLKRFL